MAEIQINNTRILVADDEEASLDIFREILEPDSMDNQNELSDLGELENKPLRKQTLQKSVPEYDLFTCRQSEEVVEAVENSITEKRPFAVAFLDVRMPPGPNGLWAAEQIRALDPAIEIVIVTAYSDVNPDDFGISLQPAHKLLYLKKPFSPQEIQQFARSLSSKWHVEQKLRASKEDLEMQVRSRTLELVDANEALKEDIIKREKTEKDLLTSEKRYRQIFENVLTPYYETSPDGTLLEISPSVEKYTKFKREELIGKSVLDLYADPDQRKVFTKKILEAGELIDEEVLIKDKDGTLLNTLLCSKYMPDEQILVGSILDITTRKRAEEALIESEAGYRSFVRVGLALSIEKDINVLLEMILDEARNLSNADAGTLYLIDDDEQHLRFEILHNDTMKARMGGTTGNDINLPKVQMYVNGEPNYANVSSYSALTGEVANIDDVYKTERFDFTGPKKYDEATGYRTKSMMVVPMADHQGELIGVLQLINALDPKTNSVVPFAPIYVDLISSLASQAAIVLTNAQLSEDLENSFNAFIKSTAAAIDKKSAYTGGHIRRVVDLTMLISKEINKAEEDPFKEIRFNANEMEELRLAAWMHDVGKITTPQYIVDKATKLETLIDCIHLVETRFQLIEKTIESIYLQKKIDLISKTDFSKSDFKNLEIELIEKISHLHEELEFLKQCNQPGEFLSKEKIDRIKKIGLMSYTYNNKEYTYLTENEVLNLTIPKGSLTEEERKIVENHAHMSYKILKEIPFPKKMAMVPDYASSHHEKPNGSGYPKGVSGNEMKLQSRIIAIADIFEALTAKDRPYRTPMNLSQAIKIMDFMKKDMEIDPDIFDLFIEKKLHLKYAKKELNAEQIDISLSEIE